MITYGEAAELKLPLGRSNASLAKMLCDDSLKCQKCSDPTGQNCHTGLAAALALAGKS